jgi:hypothetical protein
VRDRSAGHGEHFPSRQLAGIFSTPQGVMHRYSFKVSGGRHIRQDVIPRLPDNHAAQREAVAVFSDLARSFYDDIETNPQWQIEVTDEFSTPTFPVP